MSEEPQENVIKHESDSFVFFLHRAVIFAVKILALLMTAVIWFTLIAVMVHMYQKLGGSFYNLFSVENILTTLGDFLAVLIAIEIFLNIVFYLHQDKIHVSLVLATALTAVARKVIILDYQTVNPAHIASIGLIILAVGLAYWLVKKPNAQEID